MPGFFKILGIRPGRKVPQASGKTIFAVTQDDETKNITVQEIASNGRVLGGEVMDESELRTIQKAVDGFRKRHNWWRRR